MEISRKGRPRPQEFIGNSSGVGNNGLTRGISVRCDCCRRTFLTQTKIGRLFMKLRALLILATMVLGGILLSGVALAITKTCNNNCIGTNGPDSLTGSNGKNEIHAMGGGDGVQGLRGEDVLFGEDGDDELSGGPGVDGIYGGIGYDSLNGQESGDYLKDIENSGSYSTAQLPPNATFDEFLGGKGNDTIRANDGEMDKIDGGPGYDKAYVDRVDKVKGVEKEVVRGGGGTNPPGGGGTNPPGGGGTNPPGGGGTNPPGGGGTNPPGGGCPKTAQQITNPPAEPTNPPAEPTNPPAEPTNPPAEPTNPPDEPTNPPC